MGYATLIFSAATLQYYVQQRENRCGCFRFSLIEEEASQELRGRHDELLRHVSAGNEQFIE